MRAGNANAMSGAESGFAQGNALSEPPQSGYNFS